MNVLGIESSCDETSAAVVRDGGHVLSNVIASQVELHARYGGIVPEVASRQHLLQITPIIVQALEQAGVTWEEIDAVAVTSGPGLAGALLVGVNAAKAIALARGLPLVGVNHLEAHIYANFLTSDDAPAFPLLCLIVSGGHTDLVLMREHGDYQMLGRTRDDAAGEAFDKAARILGLGYPGGPVVQATAEEAEEPVPLPRAWLKGSHDFSFSGLKTALLHRAQEMGIYPPSTEDGNSQERRAVVARLAAGFQDSVVDVLVEKTVAAASQYDVRHMLLAGGVAANGPLRERLAQRATLPLSIPPHVLCTDNAAMVAACGFYRLERGIRSGWNLDVIPNWRIASRS